MKTAKNEMIITVIDSNNLSKTVTMPLTDGELFTYNVSQNDETVFISLTDVSEMSSHGVIVFYKNLHFFEIAIPVIPNDIPHTKYGLFDKITIANNLEIRLDEPISTAILSKQFSIVNSDKTEFTVDTIVITATKSRITIVEQSFNLL